MTIKYKKEKSWAFLEGSYIEYSIIPMEKHVENVKAREDDEENTKDAIVDYMMFEIYDHLKVDIRENNLVNAMQSPVTELGTICAVKVYDRERDNTTVLLLDNRAFLLSDTGKTIERLL